ncbi:MAG: anaerobic C4-dicarboxylate transporter family protein [Lactobacillus sp.]
MLKFLAELIIMVLLIVWGLRIGRALGAAVMSILGVAIMAFFFHVQPGQIAVNAVLIILSIAVAGGVLEVTGGLGYLVYLAERLIKRWPKLVTFLSPLIIFVFVFGIGTSNITLSLEPVISETALEAKIRPARPLVASVHAAQFALLCSPAAASTAFIISLLGSHGVSMHRYLGIVLPTAIISMLVLSLVMTFWHFKGGSDSEFISHAKTEVKGGAEKTGQDFSTKTKWSVVVFLLGIFAILLLGICPQIGPTFLVHGKAVRLLTDQLVILFMFASAAINMAFTHIDYRKVFAAKITKSAFGAALVVMGPGWLGGTLFTNPQNVKLVKALVGNLLSHASWVIIPIVMLVSMLCISQAATSSIIFPVALSLGISPLFMAAIVQAVNFNFGIPAIPTILFGEEIDPTGSTKRYTFLLPGLIALIVSYLVGILLMHI